MKYIKAKKCYICGQLHDIKDGGYIIAKKYYKNIFNDDIITELIICRFCTEKMVDYIAKERRKNESSGTQEETNEKTIKIINNLCDQVEGCDNCFYYNYGETCTPMELIKELEKRKEEG